jgi:large subunit ribosomal protein L13
MKTYMAKKGEVERKWVLVDASDRVLGRLATKIAMALMGKHRPVYTPHIETGDFIVVVNAAKVRFTGRKLDQKEYQRFSGYPSGLKRTTARRMMERKPTEVIRLAVRRMLPKGSLGNKMLKRLSIYAGAEHRNQAQSPQPSAYFQPKRGS